MSNNPRKRQEDVLSMIVRHYVVTAQPVGSRFISKRLGLSSATIRNVMADLEDLGLVAQPHTSAGRVPTDKGYRYYINSLMHLRSINEHIARSIEEEYGATIRSIESVLECTSHIISNLTDYVGIALFTESAKIYLDGTSHILEQPEFKDFRKLYFLLKCLEEKRGLLSVLNSDLADDHLIIHIGKENRFTYLNDCSIVTRGYKVKGKTSGRLGVIGPKRMVYEKVIPMIEFLADRVTSVLEEMED